MAEPESIEPPRAAEGLEAANQEAARVVEGQVLPPQKPVSEGSGITQSRLGAALLAAQERRGMSGLLEMAGFFSAQQEERERKLEVRNTQLEHELRNVRDERDEARLELAASNGRQDERGRVTPIQPILLLIATTCGSLAVDVLKSNHFGWAATLGLATLVCFLASCWIAFKPANR